MCRKGKVECLNIERGVCLRDGGVDYLSQPHLSGMSSIHVQLEEIWPGTHVV